MNGDWGFCPSSLVVSDLLTYLQEGKWLTTIFKTLIEFEMVIPVNFAKAGHGRWHLSEIRAVIHCLLQCPTASVPGSVVFTFKGLHL